MTGVGVGVALIILTLDTMSCNLAANLVGPAYDFSSLWPKGISYRVGGMITACTAIVMMPWKILATTQGYIFTWLVGYSALLGPVAGILMVDYFLIRGTRLNTRELFNENGEYSYTGGWNIAAIVALLVAGMVAISIALMSDPRLLTLHQDRQRPPRTVGQPQRSFAAARDGLALRLGIGEFRSLQPNFEAGEAIAPAKHQRTGAIGQPLAVDR